MALGLILGIGRAFRRKRTSSLDILSSKRAPRDYYKGKNCKPTGFHTRKGSLSSFSSHFVWLVSFSFLVFVLFCFFGFLMAKWLCRPITPIWIASHSFLNYEISHFGSAFFQLQSLVYQISSKFDLKKFSSWCGIWSMVSFSFHVQCRLVWCDCVE